ncbi:hypothetical protein [Brucella pituitosa]|nr:hypothetical protein [Brucella pituitosa]
MKTFLPLIIGVILFLVVGSLLYQATDDHAGTQPPPHSLQTNPSN